MANTIKPSAGNPIKVLNSSLEGITVTDDGDVHVQLGDAAGVKKLSVRDSGDVEVAYIDSDGIISGASGSLPVPVEGNVLIGDSTPEWALLDASADTKILVGNGTTLTSVTLSGDVTMTNAGAVTIADDAVTLAKLANVTRGSLIVGGASDAPTLLSGKTLGAILIGDGTDIGSTVNPSIAGNVGVGGTLTVNTTDLVVNGTGVGIGTTPSASLHVVGSIDSSGDKLLLFEDGTTGGYFAYVEGSSGVGVHLPTFLFQSAGKNGVGGYFKAQIPPAYDILDSGSAMILMDARQSDNTDIENANLFMLRNNGSSVLVVNESGNVCIAETTIPTGALLAVGGGISVTDGVGGEKTTIDDDIKQVMSTGTGYSEFYYGSTNIGATTTLSSLTPNSNYFPAMFKIWGWGRRTSTSTEAFTATVVKCIGYTAIVDFTSYGSPRGSSFLASTDFTAVDDGTTVNLQYINSEVDSVVLCVFIKKLTRE